MAVTNGSAPVTGSSSKHNLPSHFIGGNALELAPPSKVKDFVAAHDGHSVITSVSLPEITAVGGKPRGW